jgi:glycosyltransferase involved in cell wall biosynthesis
VIATPVGGVTDLIGHNQTGLLFDMGDSAALARAIRRLAGDEALARSLAEQAYAHLDSAFAVDKTEAALSLALVG